jgi:hypothetical protein
MRKNGEESQVAEINRKIPIDSGIAYSAEYLSMRAKQLTVDQIIALLKKKQGDGTQRDLAKELGVSQQYLNDVYLHRREPGESILKGLGVVRRVVYEQVA